MSWVMKASVLKDTTVTRLASLDLRANEIGPKGAESLAAWLAVSGALTMCHLSMNHLGNDGAAALCEAVKGRAGAGFELDLGDEPLD
jgi:Ran GTPase-activating protein (RanGAP) involved in mRNA processing and transport